MKLSVLILTRNHEPFLAQALDGVLRQRTIFEFEVVIAETGSSDATRSVAERYAARDPRIRLLPPQPAGSGPLDIRGPLRACAGEYVALLEGSDYWISEEKLARQAAFLDRQRDCVLLCHPVRFVDAAGSESRALEPQGIPADPSFDALLQQNFIHSATVVFRREALLPEIPAWCRDAAVVDWPLYLSLSLQGKIGFLDDLCAVQRAGCGRCWSAEQADPDVKTMLRVLKRMRRHVPRGVRRQVTLQIARNHYLLCERMCKVGNFYHAEKYRDIAARRGGWQLDIPPREVLVRRLKRYYLLERCAWYSYRSVHLVRDTARLLRYLAGEIPASYRPAWKLLWSEGPVGVVRGMRAKVDQFVHRRELYQAWVAAHDTLTDDDRRGIRERLAALEYQPLISIVMPVYNTPADVLEAAIASVQKQLYTRWELCIADDASTEPHVRSQLEEAARRDPRIKYMLRPANGHISAASNSALELVSGEFVALLDHDDEYAEHALYMYIEELNRHPETDLIYSDFDKIDMQGARFDPFFKTDWNPDLMRSQNMISHLGFYRTALLREIGGFSVGLEGSQDYDLALRFIERTTPERLRHIPHILYHWRAVPGSVAHDMQAKPYAYAAAARAIGDHLARTNSTATVEAQVRLGCYRLRYPLPPVLPRVSIVIRAGGDAVALKRCVESVLGLTDYKALEICIAVRAGIGAELARYLDSLKRDSRISVHVGGASASPSALANAAARQTGGELLCWLDDVIESIRPDWLKEMASHALRPEIGAVGAKLLHPHDGIREAGIVLDHERIALHVHRGKQRYVYGSFNRTHVIQNFLAVSGSGLLLRRETYAAAGGFDEQVFPDLFADVDLCLRIGARGRRILWTPYAELLHHAPLEDCEVQQSGCSRDEQLAAAAMRERWGERLGSDPYYNPNFSLRYADYRLIEPADAPRAQKPWRQPPQF